MSNNQNQQNASFRRQTLGNISPGQLSNRGGNAATRISNKDTSIAANGAAPAGNAKGRKSMMPAGASIGAGAVAPEHRSSSMGLDRRSSAYAGKPAGPKQDPRPVGDKNFQGNCIRAIITYLSTHQYPAAVSPKTLTSPTAKEFTLIVQFLMQRFDPNMKTFGKIEDDVPLFFKRLNYPFQISKSGLFAVGSPHSWPAVLAALTWLVELLNYNAKVEEGSSSNGRSSGGSSFDIEGKAKAEFFDYTCTSYRHFLAGDDARCEAVDDQFVSQFRAKEEEFAESYSKLQKSHADLLAQLERLRSEPSPLIAANQRRQDQLADADKLAALISNLQTFKQQTQRKISERQTDIKSKQDQMAEAQQENDRLRQRISVQPVNKAELHKMNLDRAKQRQVLEAVSSQCEDMERKAHAQELQVRLPPPVPGPSGLPSIAQCGRSQPPPPMLMGTPRPDRHGGRSPPASATHTKQTACSHKLTPTSHTHVFADWASIHFQMRLSHTDATLQSRADTESHTHVFADWAKVAALGAHMLPIKGGDRGADEVQNAALFATT
ncbi:MAG: hypothetical protein WDW38_002558 [Sanguina aurantia]